MNTVGFLTRHCSFSFADDAHVILVGNAPHPKRDLVLDYLKRGVMCIDFMGAVEDEDPDDDEDSYDESFLGYMAVYTDGVWLWPQYFIAYLEKYPNYQIDEEFVSHVERNKDKQIEVPEEEARRLEQQFLDVAGFKKWEGN